MRNALGAFHPSGTFLTSLIIILLKDIHDSCEPAMFSLEQLLFSVAADSRTNADILERIMPMIVEVYDRELTDRNKIKVMQNDSSDRNCKSTFILPNIFPFSGCRCQTNGKTCD